MQVRILNCPRIPVAFALTILAFANLALAQVASATTRTSGRPAIRDLAQLMAEYALPDREPTPGSLAVRLGSAVKTTDAFVHLAPEKQAGAELLTAAEVS